MQAVCACKEEVHDDKEELWKIQVAKRKGQVEDRMEDEKPGRKWRSEKGRGWRRQRMSGGKEWRNRWRCWRG